MSLISWTDPYAWMEPMQGPRWNKSVAKENARFQEALGKDKEYVDPISDVFKAAAEEDQSASTWFAEVGTTRIVIRPQPGGSLKWNWIGQEETNNPLAGDLDLVNGGIVVYSHDIGAGAERYEIVAVKRAKQLWSYRGRKGGSGLGSSVAIIGQRVYVLEAVSPLRYRWLISLDLKTGGDRRVHYEEMRGSYSLSLSHGERGCLFLIAENAGRQELFHVAARIRRLSEDGVSFFPVGFAPNSAEPCYFVRRDSFHSPWEACGHPLETFRLPEDMGHHGLDMFQLSSGIIVHRSHGERFIEVCGRRKEVTMLGKFLGEIETNPWMRWHGHTGPLHVIVTVPGRTPLRGTLDVINGIELEPPICVYGGYILSGMAHSKDGSKVRWVVSSNKNRKCLGLIVVGYGAYGIPTHMGTTRWKPFIENGFAVGFALIRGGGDHNEVWAESGRRQGKLQGVEDFEACITAMQRIVGVGPAQTCIFGRSAGGYLVGAAAVRNPGGELFGNMYAEVPYADVLRTASNPRLPLTKYEYLEFGDPAHILADFETLLRLGPVSGLGPNGAPGIFVICRTGLNDRQVYAYESVKWIGALRGRGGGAAKLLAIAGGQGHFTHGDELYRERAEDFLLLCKRILG